MDQQAEIINLYINKLVTNLGEATKQRLLLEVQYEIANNQIAALTQQISHQQTQLLELQEGIASLRNKKAKKADLVE